MSAGPLGSLRRLLKLNRDDRRMFYRLLSAQIDAGFVATRACRELAELDGLPGGIRTLAGAGGQSEREGRPAVEGMALTGLLPPEDVAVLALAQKFGSLPEALKRLANPDEQVPGVLGRVLAPNLYFATVLGILVFLIMSASGFFERMRFPGDGNPLYEASLLLQRWAPTVLWGTGLLMTVVLWVVKRSTAEPLRRVMAPFDDIERLRIGIRYCLIAAMMARNGAVGTTILEHVADVFRSSPYLRHHARQAHGRIVTEGTRLEDALADGILKPRYAALLKGLVPGRALDRYETGYRTLADVQRQMLDRRLDVLNRLLRIVLLAGIVLGFAQLFDGIYSMYDNVSTYR